MTPIVAPDIAGGRGNPAAPAPTAAAAVDLEVTDLAKRFGAVHALRDVSFAVRRGSILSLLGPSGCGKTTILNVIAGFVEPDGGAVRIGGRSVDGVPASRREVALVFQNYALFPHLTVRKNVAFGLAVRHAAPAEVAARVAAVLRVVRLEGLEDRYPRELSGGQQQRVALARALIVQPRVLLLDEPLSNLDARLRDEMRAELKAIFRSSGATTVFVTHDQNEALAMSDEVVVMNAGHVEQRGTPREVYERPRTAFVARFVGLSNLLQGRVVADPAGGACWLEAPDLPPVRLARSALPHVGEPRTILIRPEDVTVSAHPPATANAWRGVLVELQYQGPTAVCRVKTGPRELVATTAARSVTGMGEGETVYLGWEPACAVLIPE